MQNNYVELNTIVSKLQHYLASDLDKEDEDDDDEQVAKDSNTSSEDVDG